MKKIFFLFFLGLLCAKSTSAQTEGNQKTFENQDTQAKKVKVFPNPATNVVNVLGLSNSARAQISITDLHGNIFLEHRWAIRNNAVNIPVADLNPGIYMISIRSEEQNVQTKFYKQ